MLKETLRAIEIKKGNTRQRRSRRWREWRRYYRGMRMKIYLWESAIALPLADSGSEPKP